MHFQRACRQCVHESARLPRALCSHAWYSWNRGGCKTADFRFAICCTRLPRMARATNSCTRKVFFKRMENPLKWLLPRFWSLKSARREKFLYVSSRANDVRPLSRRRQHTCFAYVLIPLQAKTRVQQTSRIKDFCPIRFFFCIYRRKRKSYQKENAGLRFRALRSATRATRSWLRRLLKKAGENFSRQAKTLIVRENFNRAWKLWLCAKTLVMAEVK